MSETVAQEKERELREAEKQLDSITIGTEPKQILAANRDRKAYLIYNNGEETLTIGFNSSVTPGNGIPVIPQRAVSDQKYKGAFWGIVASGSIDVRYLEVT